jgi:hypothetical protein
MIVLRVRPGGVPCANTLKHDGVSTMFETKKWPNSTRTGTVCSGSMLEATTANYTTRLHTPGRVKYCGD